MTSNLKFEKITARLESMGCTGVIYQGFLEGDYQDENSKDHELYCVTNGNLRVLNRPSRKDGLEVQVDPSKKWQPLRSPEGQKLLQEYMDDPDSYMQVWRVDTYESVDLKKGIEDLK